MSKQSHEGVNVVIDSALLTLQASKAFSKTLIELSLELLGQCL